MKTVKKSGAGSRRSSAVVNRESSIVNLATRSQLLDLYFLDARSKLIDLAAFLDRLERSEGEGDFRLKAFREALSALNGKRSERAAKVLLAFSDPTTEPVAAATSKGAVGAFAGK